MTLQTEILIMITIKSFLDFECIYYKSFIINIHIYFLHLNLYLLNITFKLYICVCDVCNYSALRIVLSHVSMQITINMI